MEAAILLQGDTRGTWPLKINKSGREHWLKSSSARLPCGSFTRRSEPDGPPQQPRVRLSIWCAAPYSLDKPGHSCVDW
jgi:hypothetical protein